MKHNFINNKLTFICLSESLKSHCYRKAVLLEIRSPDDKKIKLSVENSVKLYAIVFGYYVNAM